MPCYFDSSALLAPLLGQAEAGPMVEIWDAHTDRVSSILLEAECVSVLRRAALLQPADEADRFLQDRIQVLDDLLDDLSLRNVDAAVTRWLRVEPRLAGGRTLDAIHLATALLCRENSEDRVAVVTLDTRLRSTAEKLGFEVIP